MLSSEHSAICCESRQLWLASLGHWDNAPAPITSRCSTFLRGSKHFRQPHAMHLLKLFKVER